MAVRFLISFFYFRNTALDQYLTGLGESPDLVADSGAYSAFTQGSLLSVSEYAEWLLRWKHLFACYINLDVKGDVDAGLRNQIYLESCGLKPIPVFHGGEPWSIFQDMCKTYPYVALGGLAGHTQSGSPQMIAFVKKCFEIAADKKVALHALGTTSVKMLRMFPWYSVDSSSWASVGRYGVGTITDPNSLRSVKVKDSSNKSWLRYAKFLRKAEFDYQAITVLPVRSRERRYLLYNEIALNVVRLEAGIRRRHGEVIHPQAKTTGLRFYMATVDLNDAVRMSQYVAEKAHAVA